MENFEVFGASDKKEGLSQAEIQAFEEKMQKAAKEMRAAKKKEQKHKKKEEDLYKILLDFIKNSKNTVLVSKITDCLEKNIPAGFILAIIRLSNKEIESILGELDPSETKIAIFGEETDFSPLMKVELNLWIKSLIDYALENNEKILKKSLIHSENGLILEKKLTELTSFIIFEYTKQHNVLMEDQKIQYFANFILRGVLDLKEKELLKP
ncbi:MAG: hypothetical protein RBS56_03965 [Candidatus Gracilibacteria bacterium]|jgi:hypothetical protein|nr:hypothetical protein [Candidatus Gracilibacteria bacterium]